MTLSAIALCLAMNSCGGDNATTNEADTATHEHAGQQYQCPMDCEKGKTYDAEGKCPECNMDLKAVE